MLWVNSSDHEIVVASTWSAKLAKHRLHRGAFASVVALQEAIHHFVATHNRDPKPLFWPADPRGYHRRCKERVPSVRFAPLGSHALPRRKSLAGLRQVHRTSEEEVVR